MLVTATQLLLATIKLLALMLLLSMPPHLPQLTVPPKLTLLQQHLPPSLTHLLLLTVVHLIHHTVMPKKKMKMKNKSYH